MRYRIRWSNQARISYLSILEYLEISWSFKEVEGFSKRLEEVIAFASVNPKIYPKSDKNNVRRAVVTRQVSLFFEINGEFVDLLFLWDNRQDPTNMKS
jgi:plasmid stabilization system protein ParE